MLKKDNIYKVLEVFFDDPLPTGGFQLREISRKISLAPKSVKLYLEKLRNQNLIVKKEHRIHKYPVYEANTDNNYFRFLKRLDIRRKIEESDLLDYLQSTCKPDAIILFGSASRGQDTKESDVDLYLQSEEKKLDLDEYEKKLNRRINIIFKKNFDNLSNELKTNIVNGDVLEGYLKCKFYYGHLRKR